MSKNHCNVCHWLKCHAYLLLQNIEICHSLNMSKQLKDTACDFAFTCFQTFLCLVFTPVLLNLVPHPFMYAKLKKILQAFEVSFSAWRFGSHVIPHGNTNTRGVR